MSMKITYLGTAAAEGFPAVFCNCQYCNAARRLGGKNIRTRSQALINDDLLLDFPADTYSHFLRNEVCADQIKYLLITHPHQDHLYPGDLSIRGGAYAHDMLVQTMRIFGSEAVCNEIGKTPRNTEITVLKPFEAVEIGDYRVTPLPARHTPEGGALIYLIEGDKTLLYAHDTGYFYEEVFSYIEKNKIKLDMISLDCTNVDIPITDEGRHMGFPNIARVLERLSAMGAVHASTKKFVNHFSNNGNPLHHLLEQRAGEYGCSVSYDGCSVTL